MPRPRLEVADILRVHGEEYRRRHPVSAAQLTVMRHIEQCRTAALGGHIDFCLGCGRDRNSFNSCRDRHCPKCQGLKKAEWLEARCAHLLPIPYWHVVFTIPDSLNPLALRNKKVVFDILFDTTAQTLQEFTRDPRHLGAEIGFTAVLHTWGQNLLFHPHLHCVVTGGGLKTDDSRWIATSPKFFLPVDALGLVLRGKFLDALDVARNDGKLEFEGSTAHLAPEKAWRNFLGQLPRKWVVYAKPPFAGPEQVYRYLGHYTHRVAISNHRLVAMVDDVVTFSWKNYRRGGKRGLMRLHGLEFIRRFLLHVLPKKFVRIRHYGLLSSRNLYTKLARARDVLCVHAEQPPRPARPPRTTRPWWDRLLALTGIDIFLCPFCKTGRLVRRPLLPARASAARAP